MIGEEIAINEVDFYSGFTKYMDKVSGGQPIIIHHEAENLLCINTDSMLGILKHVTIEAVVKKDSDGTFFAWMDEFSIYGIGTTIEEAKNALVDELYSFEEV